MIDRLMAWLKDGRDDFSGDEIDPRLAVAALLMDAALVDGRLDAGERAAVHRLLERRFGLSDAAAAELAAAAERTAENSTQLFGFTRIVNERFTRERRVELIEMLWEVAYADGTLDPLEDAMLRQVGGLVDVPDHERGEARRRVMQRLGIPPEI